MKLSQQLALDRCPHCQVAHPTLGRVGAHDTNDFTGENPRKWFVYQCSTCGKLVTAWARKPETTVVQYFPENMTVSEEIPERPKSYLQQACESIHAPAGSIMLCASSVDAMLKLKNYNNGSLYERIEAAAKDHLITNDMAKWAHEVRLDANDQRHSDESQELPTEEDARRCIDFVKAFAEYLFVLPARIKKGISESGDKQ